MRFRAIAVLTALGLAASGPSAVAQEASFRLELIGSESKATSCAFIFDAQNKLGVDIDDLKVQIYGLSATNVAQGVWLLSFSDIKNKKRQIKSFDLPKSCDKIVKFNVNGFTECKGDKDYLDLCNKGLKLSSTIEVDFSNDAE